MVASARSVTPYFIGVTWVHQAEVEAEPGLAPSSEEAEELKRLRRENAELRRANDIIRAAGPEPAVGRGLLSPPEPSRRKAIQIEITSQDARIRPPQSGPTPQVPHTPIDGRERR
jgi:hypothetical protein